jgi:hypothetical protein
MLQNLTTIDWTSVASILENPIILAALLAIIRNLGGYAYNCFEAKALLPYSASQFLVTLGLWETLFVALDGVVGLSATSTAIVTFALDFIRGLKTAITNAVNALTTKT